MAKLVQTAGESLQSEKYVSLGLSTLITCVNLPWDNVIVPTIGFHGTNTASDQTFTDRSKEEYKITAPFHFQLKGSHSTSSGVNITFWAFPFENPPRMNIFIWEPNTQYSSYALVESNSEFLNGGYKITKSYRPFPFTPGNDSFTQHIDRVELSHTFLQYLITKGFIGMAQTTTGSATDFTASDNAQLININPTLSSRSIAGFIPQLQTLINSLNTSVTNLSSDNASKTTTLNRALTSLQAETPAVTDVEDGINDLIARAADNKQIVEDTTAALQNSADFNTDVLTSVTGLISKYSTCLTENNALTALKQYILLNYPTSLPITTDARTAFDNLLNAYVPGTVGPAPNVNDMPFMEKLQLVDTFNLVCQVPPIPFSLNMLIEFGVFQGFLSGSASGASGNYTIRLTSQTRVTRNIPSRVSQLSPENILLAIATDLGVSVPKVSRVTLTLL